MRVLDFVRGTRREIIPRAQHANPSILSEQLIFQISHSTMRPCDLVLPPEKNVGSRSGPILRLGSHFVRASTCPVHIHLDSIGRVRKNTPHATTRDCTDRLHQFPAPWKGPVVPVTIALAYYVGLDLFATKGPFSKKKKFLRALN